jgi:hydrogenase maturation protein HypF
MCLAIPGRITEIYEVAGLPMGKVDFGGVVKEACLAYLENPVVGDYTMIHVGFAISKVDEAEAQRTLELLREMGELEAEFGDLPPDDEAIPIWRSRSCEPYTVRLPFTLPPLLAVGGELKLAFCVARGDTAVLSPQTGDLSDYDTLQAFERRIAEVEQQYQVQPQIIAHDLHPDYHATGYALRRAAADQLPAVAVQHHHAHIAAVLAEHGHAGDHPVIGVSFDGTGYGTDATIWGGEFLIADYAQFQRAAYLKPVRLPGGDAATRKPARIALSYLLASGVSLTESLPPLAALTELEQRIATAQIERGLNAPFTSSMGRLFDAVSALIGVCEETSYEGQAAIELEAAVDLDETDAYRFDTTNCEIDTAPVIRAAAADSLAGVPVSTIAARFHNGLAAMIADVCQRIAAQTGLREVALSGGVFQNVTLLEKTLPLLDDFVVYTHRLVPPNDGGLALGQAVIAAAQSGQIVRKG